ncbi:MAG: NUDIX hydrolase [Oscillospiraceae bacterium]|nr:NUDIX hydrolase [Oscillospiraceae bacterium]
MHLYEETVESKVMFEGRVVTVCSDKARLEDGKIAGRDLVIHPGGVCIVPLTDDNEVIMVKQFRYAFKTVLLEVPAGKLEPGEDPAESGKRELSEEIGARCDSYDYLGVCYPSVAYLTEKIHIYLARGLHFGETHYDEDEHMDIVRIPLEKAYEMVLNNEIPDAKTQIAIMKTYNIVFDGKK